MVRKTENPNKKLFRDLMVVVGIKVILLLLILFIVMPPSKRENMRDEYGLSSIKTNTLLSNMIKHVNNF